jgi:hypothetical protein
MVVPVVTSARARCACGGTDCPDCPPGACADGEECLPSDFIDPADCPPATCETLEPTLLESDSEEFGGGVNTVTTASITAGSGPYVLLIGGQMGDANGYDVDGCDLTWHTVEEFNPNGNLIHLTAYFGVGTPSTGVITAVPKAGATFNNRAAWMVLDVPGLFSIDPPSSADFGTTTPVGVAIEGETCEGDVTLAFATSGRDLSGALTSWSAGWDPLAEEMLGQVGDFVLGWSSTADQNPEAEFEETFDNAEAGMLGFILRSSCGCPSCDSCCDECPPSVGVECDYLPYCLNGNEDDPQTILAAMSPFALHMLDEASAATVAVDSSGNGNNGALSGTRAQLGAGLSDKTGAAFNLGANSGAVSLVSPTGTGLGTDGAEFAIVALVRLNDIGAASNNFPTWLSHCSSGNNFDFLLIADGDDSGAHLVETRGEPSCCLRPDWISLDVPLVFVLNGPSDVQYALGARSTWEVWIDGVLVTAGMRRNTGDFAGGVKFGQPTDTFFGSPDMDIGPIVTFDRALSYAEIREITEVLLDSTIASGGRVP